VADLKGQEIRDAYDDLLTKGSGTAIEDGDGHAFIVAIVNNLTSTATTAPLAANQGTVLNDTTVKLTGAQSVAGVKTLTDIVRATAGINFNASGGDTLNGHNIGTFTPTLSFPTNGDLNIVYSDQTGLFWDLGDRIFVYFRVLTSTFTHSTASGSLRLSMPSVVKNIDNYLPHGSCRINYTKAGYTSVTPFVVFNSNLMNFFSEGSGVVGASLVAADMPSGTNVSIIGNITYRK